MSNSNPELDKELRDLIRSLLLTSKVGLIHSDETFNYIYDIIGEYASVYSSLQFLTLRVYTLVDTTENRKALKEILKILEI